MNDGYIELEVGSLKLLQCLVGIDDPCFRSRNCHRARHGDEVRKAIDRGDFNGALHAVGELPLKQRIEWIDELAEIRPRFSSPIGGANRPEVGQLPDGDFQAGDGDGNGGGGAIADFRSLINLIETTIDGNWESDGGTNTITQFRSGVWIDTNGLVQERVLKKGIEAGKGVSKGKASDAIVLPDLGGWQTKSRFRWVSLKKLALELESRRRGGKVPSMSMELVGGLARIEAVSYDAATKDWYLGGPAGGFQLRRDGELVQVETGLPPVLLEDLLSVAPQVFAKKGGSVVRSILSKRGWLQCRPFCKILRARSCWPSDLKNGLNKLLKRLVLKR